MRLFVELDRRSQEIQASRESWSYTIVGFSEEQENALRAFNKKQVRGCKSPLGLMAGVKLGLNIN
jgi:hypothetical protein